QRRGPRRDRDRAAGPLARLRVQQGRRRGGGARDVDEALRREAARRIVSAAMAPTGEALANVTQAAVDRHITGADGQRTALRFGDKQYSFHDLAALTNRAGNML